MLKKIRLLPIDIISYIYILFNIVFISLGHNRIEDASMHLGIFLGIALLIFWIILTHHLKNNKLTAFLRYWYPFLFLSYFFDTSTIINRVIFTDYIDTFFQNIDMLIFGYQPAIEWGFRFNNIIIQEIFHFSYFSYYLILPGIALLIYLKKRDYFEQYVFIVMFVFYICYITYAFLPVIGARYWQELFELTMTYRGGPFTRIMAFIYGQSQHFGSAFPSSHVAVTVIINIAVFRYSSKVGTYLIPLTVLLTISTVYCHYHYFIDTVFGVIYAVVLYKPAIILYNYLTNKIEKMANKG